MTLNEEEKLYEDDCLLEMVEDGPMSIFIDSTPQEDGSVRAYFNLVANDIFAWALAEYESCTYEDIIPIYKAWKAGRITNWICQHRKEKPQKPLEDIMRENGTWDEAMEQLPPNRYDTLVLRRQYDTSRT